MKIIECLKFLYRFDMRYILVQITPVLLGVIGMGKQACPIISKYCL